MSMNMPRILRIKLDKLREDEYPVAVAINDDYIVFAREVMKIKEDEP